MGKIFQKIETHITDVLPGSVFVEIGSDRGEGSTHELDRLAGQHRTRLISVDILNRAKATVGHELTNTDFIVDGGREWAEQYQGPQISCLYLDNFDYIWDVRDTYGARWLVTEYASRGITMNNSNSQIEHLAQLIALYPFLSPDAAVMFDDTYPVNDCWIGKCGPGVVFLQVNGWKIVETTEDCGVIMKRENRMLSD